MSPISCFHHVQESLDHIFDDLNRRVPQAFIDGLLVHAHRLLGNPPSNPAYVCNWDFDIGKITGNTGIPFLQAFDAAIDSFVYNLIDAENALPEITLPDRDVTFLRVNAAGVSLEIPFDTQKIFIEIGPVTMGADDRTSLLRSSKATINVQSLSAQILNREQVVASISTALGITALGRRQDIDDHGPKQATHVRDNDAASRRAWFLYSEKVGRGQGDLEKLEIDLPPLSRERVEKIHSRLYSPKCCISRREGPIPATHFAGSFLGPDYGFGFGKDKVPRPPYAQGLKGDTRMFHSSLSDLVKHLGSLPPGQKTFIVEVSPDTTLMLTSDAIQSAELLFQAVSRVTASDILLMIGSDRFVGQVSTRDRLRNFG